MKGHPLWVAFFMACNRMVWGYSLRFASLNTFLYKGGKSVSISAVQ